MLDEEQQQLFGAPMGRLLSATIDITTPEMGHGWVLRLTCVAANRKTPMCLQVQLNDGQELCEPLGKLTAVASRCYRSPAEVIRQRMIQQHHDFTHNYYASDIWGVGRVDR